MNSTGIDGPVDQASGWLADWLAGYSRPTMNRKSLAPCYFKKKRDVNRFECTALHLPLAEVQCVNASELKKNIPPHLPDFFFNTRQSTPHTNKK